MSTAALTYVRPAITDFGSIWENTFTNPHLFPGGSATLLVHCNSGRGNLSETDTGTHQTNSDTLINPHDGNNGGGSPHDSVTTNTSTGDGNNGNGGNPHDTVTTSTGNGNNGNGGNPHDSSTTNTNTTTGTGTDTGHGNPHGNPHNVRTLQGLGPGPAPTDDCDPGNSGAVNHGGD